MFKVSMMRFFALVVIVFCIGTHVSAEILGKLQGPGSKRIVLDKNTIDYQIDYTQTYAFYNTTDNKQEQFYTLDIGGCKLEFKAGWCPDTEINRHHRIQEVGGYWQTLHDNFPFGTVKSSSISFHSIHYLSFVKDYPCNVNFDSNSVSGKYVIDVSLSGEVSPDLVVNFGEDIFIDTSKKIETWRIVLVVLTFVVPLVICSCIVGFCWYKTIYIRNHAVFKGTLNTVSTVQGPLVNETNSNGPNTMNNRNTTQTEPDTKSQATNSMQTPK